MGRGGTGGLEAAGAGAGAAAGAALLRGGGDDFAAAFFFAGGGGGTLFPFDLAGAFAEAFAAAAFLSAMACAVVNRLFKPSASFPSANHGHLTMTASVIALSDTPAATCSRIY